MSPTRRRYFNAEGIVVRARDLGEADRIVILLTPNRGLISCVARGARRTTSRTGGHVDLLRHITAHISEGRSDLHVISQVETVNAYLPLRNDLDRLTLASHFAEISERFSLQNAANPHLFALLRDSLTYAESTPKPTLSLLRLWHETTLLTTTGLQPQLHRCVRTNTEIPPDDHWFSPSEGGLIKRPDQVDTTTSPDPIAFNHPETTPIIPAPLNTIKLLRHITRTPDWGRLEGLRVDTRDVEGGLRVMGAMLRYQQERGVGRAERVMGEVSG
ncbi:MAG: DNA repair protein RecO [Chloroflexi bacterium]|nr:DNA repair protein RecO [Chloroflexota bacterium]